MDCPDPNCRGYATRRFRSVTKAGTVLPHYGWVCHTRRGHLYVKSDCGYYREESIDGRGYWYISEWKIAEEVA